MQRVKTTTAVAVLPADPAGGTPGFFANPNPGGGVPATVPNYEWYNNVQEEILAVIEGAGLTASGSDRTQLKQAITRMITGGDFKDSARVASTANIAALTGLLTVDGVVLIAGDRVLVKDQTTGSQNGIYVAAAGAWARATDADTGDELSAGVTIPVEAGTLNADTLWMLTTDGTIVVGTTALVFALKAGDATLIISDQKALGTHAGASVAGSQTRTLNTVEKNTIAGASLSSNQIILPAGTYRIDAIVPGVNVNGHRAHLYNVTDAAVALLGTNENSTATGSGDLVITCSRIAGDFTIAAQKTFEIRHYTVEVQASYGLGWALNVAGFVEQYTKVLIDRR